MAEHKIVDGVAVPLSDDDKAQAVIDAADALAKAPARIMAAIRAKRDTALAATDWWGASDNTMTDEQTSYRSALRDVPAQADLNNITWPEKP